MFANTPAVRKVFTLFFIFHAVFLSFSYFKFFSIFSAWIICVIFQSIFLYLILNTIGFICFSSIVILNHSNSKKKFPPEKNLIKRLDGRQITFNHGDCMCIVFCRNDHVILNKAYFSLCFKIEKCLNL